MATDTSLRLRLYVAGVIGGLAAVLVFVLLVLRFGERTSSPPSLQARPNAAIPGRIAYVDRKNCIVVIDAAGASREQVYCVGTPPTLLLWRDANTVVFADTVAPRVSLTAIDLATRTTRDAGEIEFDPLGRYPYAQIESSDGARAEVDAEGRLYVTHQGVRTQVADFDLGRSGWLVVALWSPDGAWLALQHSRPGVEGELWIVSRDGTIAGTLVDDLGPPLISWWIDGKGYTPKPPAAGPNAPPTPIVARSLRTEGSAFVSGRR